jgi:hypothetical protein
MDLPQKSMTFIVRIDIHAADRITGVLERVSTGQKYRLHGMDDITSIIRRLASETRDSDAHPPIDQTEGD